MPPARAEHAIESPDERIARLELQILDLTAQLAERSAGRPAFNSASALHAHTARGPPPVWLNIKKAAGRYGCGYERMRRLAELGAVVSRRVDGLISISTASVDERLRSLGRKPVL
jgi:hypothetical protein